MSGDYMLFKYRAIDPHLTDSIINRTWHFSKPDRLNDPFDCRVDIRKALARAASSTSGLRAKKLQAALERADGMLDAWVQQFAEFGVCAFSLTSKSELLWAHYADKHCGVVLKYQFDANSLKDPKYKVVSFDFVKYGQNAVTNYLKTATIDQQDANGFVNELGRLYLTAKAEAWKYEEELRIIRTTSGPMEIPRGTLRGVIFGLRTPQPEIERIIKLARQYSDCDVFSQMRPDDSDFGFVERGI